MSLCTGPGKGDRGMPHATMARVAFVFWLLLHVFLGASSNLNFVSEPPLTRLYVGNGVTMEWTLSSDPEQFSQSGFFNETDVRIISRAHGGADTIGPGYDGRVSFYNTSSRGLGFRLTGLTLRDAGRYRCRHQPVTQPPIESSSVLFIFGQPDTPVISLKRYGQIGDPFTGYLKEGGDVTLLCAASSTSLPAADRPAMAYTWTRNGQPIDRNSPPDRHSVPNDSGRRLDISPLSRDDVTYRCTAQEEGSTVNSQTTRDLNVLYAPSSVTVTPSSPVTTVEGESLVLEGRADCNPSCQYSWTLNGDSLPQGTSGRLQIDSIRRDKHGTYSVRAHNVLGSLSQTVEVTVNYPPTVTMTIDPEEGSRGDRVEIKCEVDSRPLSQVTWTNVTGSGIPRGTVIAGQRQPTLTLDPADCLDSGTIKCTADNGVKSAASDQRELNVFCPPRLDPAERLIDQHAVLLGGNATFLVYVIANPAPEAWTYTLTTENQSTYDNNVNGVTLSPSGNPGTLTIASVQPHHYGNYDITVTNDQDQPLVIPLKLQTKGPPESPEEFKVRDVTCVGVTLQWQAGFSGGSPQTFHLSYRGSGATEWVTLTVEDSGQDIISHKVNNLQQQTVYEFKLFAKNADGSTEDKALRSTAETTACPKFVADSLVISIQDNIAMISWQFTQRVDRVEVKCCNDRCMERTVDQPTAQQPITMEVPPGSQNYIFTFKLFQDGELVFSSEIKHYPGNNAAIIAAVTTTVIVIIIVIVVVIVVIVLRRKRRVSKRDATPLYENTGYQNDRSAPDAVQHKSTETGAATELEASQVEIQTLLSDGTGFQVYSAQVQIGLSLNAAVIKGVKDAESLKVYSRYLAGQMEVLLSLKHVNVVKLLGFQRGCGGEYENVASMSSVSLVLEPATQEDLHTFLTAHGAGVYQKTVTMETMMGMALGIATGAHALSENKPAALHHYICAKHVLVDDRGLCKLTGFSTAEAVRAREEWEAIHKSERPVRWMSAETLNHLEHTTKSDVWSFAIFLWELFSLGEMPYPGLEDDEVQTAIQDGNRLEKPNNCDPTTYELMVECWMRNTERRPDFQYVMKCLMKYQSEKINASADEHTYEAVV